MRVYILAILAFISIAPLYAMEKKDKILTTLCGISFYAPSSTRNGMMQYKNIIDSDHSIKPFLIDTMYKPKEELARNFFSLPANRKSNLLSAALITATCHLRSPIPFMRLHGICHEENNKDTASQISNDIYPDDTFQFVLKIEDNFAKKPGSKCFIFPGAIENTLVFGTTDYNTKGVYDFSSNYKFAIITASDNTMHYGIDISDETAEKYERLKVIANTENTCLIRIPANKIIYSNVGNEEQTCYTVNRAGDVQKAFTHNPPVGVLDTFPSTQNNIIFHYPNPINYKSHNIKMFSPTGAVLLDDQINVEDHSKISGIQLDDGTVLLSFFNRKKTFCIQCYKKRDTSWESAWNTEYKDIPYSHSIIFPKLYSAGKNTAAFTYCDNLHFINTDATTKTVQLDHKDNTHASIIHQLDDNSCMVILLSTLSVYDSIRGILKQTRQYRNQPIQKQHFFAERAKDILIKSTLVGRDHLALLNSSQGLRTEYDPIELRIFKILKPENTSIEDAWFKAHASDTSLTVLCQNEQQRLPEEDKKQLAEKLLYMKYIQKSFATKCRDVAYKPIYLMHSLWNTMFKYKNPTLIHISSYTYLKSYFYSAYNWFKRHS